MAKFSKSKQQNFTSDGAQSILERNLEEENFTPIKRLSAISRGS